MAQVLNLQIIIEIIQETNLIWIFLFAVKHLKESGRNRYIPLQKTQSTSQCMSYQKRKMNVSSQQR